MSSYPAPKDCCIDCGPAPTSHSLSFISSLFIAWLTPLSLSVSRVKGLVAKIAHRLQIHALLRMMLWGLAALKIGRIARHPHDRISDRARLLWQEATRKGIDFYEFQMLGRSQELFVASCRGRTMIFQNLPRPFSYSSALEWIDDKAHVRARLTAASLPFPPGGVVRNAGQALRVYSRLNTPVVVKPRLGSRGRHVHLHIRTPEQLMRAYESARRLCPWVVVEEELQGDVYRILLLRGRMEAVARRNYPQIEGDGIHTIRTLTEEENKNPIRTGSIFHHIPINDITSRYLTLTNKHWDDVPDKGETVILDRGVIRERGGLTEDVTDGVHRENKRLFERIARVVGDPLIGVDFIIADIGSPWYEQAGCGIIELNAMPFLDLHHYCVSGNPRNVSSMLWDMIYP